MLGLSKIYSIANIFDVKAMYLIADGKQSNNS